jgi:hypothetical protein
MACWPSSAPDQRTDGRLLENLVDWAEFGFHRRTQLAQLAGRGQDRAGRGRRRWRAAGPAAADDDGAGEGEAEAEADALGDAPAEAEATRRARRAGLRRGGRRRLLDQAERLGPE